MLSKFCKSSINSGVKRFFPGVSQVRTFYSPKPQEEDSRHVEQRWWTGKSAIPEEEFIVDAKKNHNMSKILGNVDAEGKCVIDVDSPEAKGLKNHLKEVWDRHGCFQMKNTGMTTMSQMEALTRLHMPSKPKIYEGGANKRSALEGNVYDIGAPGPADLSYHHEMAYVKKSVQWLSFGCFQALNDGMRGCTFLADNAGATKMLMDTPLGEKMKTKGLCYIRKLPDKKFFDDNNLDDSIVYNYWQTSMLTDDPAEAEAEARRMGLDVEWQDSPVFGRYMVTKFYASAFEYDPVSDKNTLFASIADDYVWFQKWPGIAELPHWERPLKLNFGDDEIMTREEKQLFTDAYDMHGVPINWESGDLAMLCNWRHAHGRPAYSCKPGEKRELGVILGDEFNRVNEVADKW